MGEGRDLLLGIDVFGACMHKDNKNKNNEIVVVLCHEKYLRTGRERGVRRGASMTG
jgi:hypothetical protein